MYHAVFSNISYPVYSTVNEMVASGSVSLYKKIKTVLNSFESPAVVSSSKRAKTTRDNVSSVLKDPSHGSRQDSKRTGSLVLPPKTSDDFSPERPQIIASGVFGDVSKSKEGFVIKTFKNMADIKREETQKNKMDLKKIAEEEVYLFNLYYGEGSASLLSDETTLQIEMKEIKGSPLDKIEDSDFERIISSHVKAFYDMTQKLFSVGIIHGDFLLKNIMFFNGVFYPIDFCHATPENVDEHLKSIKSTLSFVKNKDERIEMNWTEEEGKIQLTLQYINTKDESKNTSLSKKILLKSTGDDSSL